jgi:hypothetical protein
MATATRAGLPKIAQTGSYARFPDAERTRELKILPYERPA